MRRISWILALVMIAVIMVSGMTIVACGDDDDDDDDDDDGDDDDDEYPEVGENGIGTSDDDLLGAGTCNEDDCAAMLTFMDGCEFPCVDTNGEPTACINLTEFCAGCTGNWSCNLTCFTGQVSCQDFLNCCIACTN